MQSVKQEQVVQLIQAGQHREALAVLEGHLSAEPNDWYAYYMSGVAYRFIGALDRAVFFLTKAAELKPGEAPVLLALGISHQLSGHFDEAVAALKQAIDHRMDFVEAYNSLGLTYRKMGRITEALDSYNEGTERMFELASAQVHKNPSLCYREEVIDGKATRTVLPYVFVKTFELLKSNPLYATLRNNAGVCFAELGDIESARNLYMEAIEYTPDGYDYSDPVRNLESLDS